MRQFVIVACLETEVDIMDWDTHCNARIWGSSGDENDSEMESGTMGPLAGRTRSSIYGFILLAAAICVFPEDHW